MSVRFKSTLLYPPPKILEQPPLGIATVAGHMREKGHEVSQRDLNFELFMELGNRELFDDKVTRWWEFSFFYKFKIKPRIKTILNKWAEELANDDGHIIGISAFHHNVPFIQDLAALIKKRNPRKIIVVGGPQTTYSPESLYHDSIDFLVIGDGEVIFEDLVKTLEEGKHPSTVSGIAFKQDGSWVKNSERKNTLDLNKIAPPDFDDFPLKSYPNLAIPLETSRGCVYRCTFCSETVMFSPFRYKKAPQTFFEIETLVAKTRDYTNFYYFTDSLINGHIRELDDLCDVLLEKKIGIHWGGKAVIREKMTREFLQKLFDSGCRLLDFGIESASPKVLKDMKKSFTKDVASRVIKDCHDIGIQVHLMWIVGFPTEEESDFQESLDFVKDNHPYIHAISPGYGCTVHDPRADLMKNPQKYGIYWKWGGLWKTPHNWFSKSTTPSIRNERVKRFHELCHNLEMNVW